MQLASAISISDEVARIGISIGDTVRETIAKMLAEGRN